MPALILSAHTGTVTFLGTVALRKTSLRSVATDSMTLSFAGAEGEDHSGLTRKSCTRFRDVHAVGTEVRNTRQLSVLSAAEMTEIATRMQMDSLDPQLIGASIILSGIPDLSHLPPGSRLQGPDGATITVDLENGPCVWPGKEIEADHPGHGTRFQPAAEGRRGFTAWVERPGTLRLGDPLRLFVPTQQTWRPD